MYKSQVLLRRRSGGLRHLGWLSVGSMLALAVLTPGTTFATSPKIDGEHKVTICHRTNSVTNPYVVITVDYSGADGGLVHDNGNGDHTDHLGPVFDANNPPPPPHNGDQWGDIIPPFSWPGDANHAGGSFPGYNWSDAGKLIWRSDCVAEVTTTTSTTDSSTDSSTQSTTSTTDSSTDSSTTSTTDSSTDSSTTSTTDSSTDSSTQSTTSTTDSSTDSSTQSTTDSTTQSTTDSTTSTVSGTESSTSSTTGESSGGGVLGVEGTPKATLPATSTIAATATTGSPDSLRYILLGLAVLLASMLLLQPKGSSTRK
jgi:hypothetical protein